ncbi:hypothetical protein A2686_03760 [Candidatus Woesebacteria bacterium RIFCSPHIGHO2_01_FULL_38_10]|uniref:SpoVT-AbrB domain-containing protein n=1 Tax=Candidatus Woesebacteria bacterium RIFCSPLOWO2_01_FULL_39_10b TaxID=1802517 RepID=A0A1F8B849_9BACT|nr:MAG: hypothetical protein A2686_03760 [Candidatus Woesebacteria bacterium RIFCSPHIGHO2_01_FULL_38_10]OGM59879.1 MAG: hypothetical protein A2892_02755 [Candidatus Woesebacteria bacterium RIFCSPLOWO2_01_FULL_39_10b]
MPTQIVFRAGNSNVVAIPKNLSRELGFKSGLNVVVSKIPGEDAIVIRKATKAAKVKEKTIDREFKNWLDNVLQEDKEILDELAVR